MGATGTWTTVTSSGAGGGVGERNDDLARVVVHGDTIDVVLLDGATSLAERDAIDAERGDPAWFVRAFADALERMLRAGQGGMDQDPYPDQDRLVRAAVAELHDRWQAAGAGRDTPRWAWPIAALSWVRIARAGDGVALTLYCLGDCKLLLATPDGAVIDPDPYDNAHEHHLQRAVAALAADGMDDPAKRFEALLPQLRMRREAQQAASAPDVLCLAPADGFAARRHALRVPAGTHCLAMTDGFYRLVDPYGAFDDAGLAHACARDGLAPVLALLRRIEAEADTGRGSVKRADDATAIMVRRDA